MKWKNVDIGVGCYYITATFTEWLPLFNNEDVRAIVCQEIRKALVECNSKVSAYVLMPDHTHLLVYLSEGNLLHRFNKNWRGRSARKIIAYAEDRGTAKVLNVMAKHANGKSRYAVWKEQVRALAIWSDEKARSIVNYIHANPVRRGLVEHPGDWQFSSYRFYEYGESMGLDVEPLDL